MRNATLVAVLGILVLAASAHAQWNFHTIDDNAYGYCKTINDSIGRPHVFYKGQSYDIWHTSWDGSSWRRERVAQAMCSYGFGAALGRQGRWMTAWGEDLGQCRLHYCYYLGGNWRDTVIAETTYNAYAYENAAIAADTAGNPHIVTWNASLQRFEHRWYTPETPPTWQMDVVDNGTQPMGQGLSMVVDSLNRVCVAYYSDGALRFAHRAGGTWHSYIVDYAGQVGEYCDLKLDRNGRACISYYDATNGDLKYAVGTFSADGKPAGKPTGQR